ncbi:hypothetical protein UlMin_032308 [Ulmus minor]
MQALLEGPPINQGRLEAPKPEAKIYAYTKEDVDAGTSNVVTGQLFITNVTLRVLFDSGATHSFDSTVHANVLVSTQWLRAIPVVVANQELYVDLIILDMYDYDVILGMNFLSKYNATIECRHRRVNFRPNENDEFSYTGEGFLATVVDTTRVEKSGPEGITVVWEFTDVFPEELPGLPPDREISFEIDLIPSSAPVSKAPYRMAPAELKEL